jgi:hypothetical protein
MRVRRSSRDPQHQPRGNSAPHFRNLTFNAASWRGELCESDVLYAIRNISLVVTRPSNSR